MDEHNLAKHANIRSSDELFRWSFFWFFLMAGLAITSAEKRSNKLFIIWVIYDIIFGVSATVSMMIAVIWDLKGGVLLWGRDQFEWALLIAPVMIHLCWWATAPLWPVSDGSFAIAYAFKHPLESNIPILWLIDGLFVILQPLCQLRLRTEPHPLLQRMTIPLSPVERSNELLRWSFFWLFVLLCLVSFDACLRFDRGYVKWMILEWPFMLLSTCLMKKAVRGIAEQNDGTFPWWKASLATVILHFMWWISGLAMIWTIRRPLERSTPFLWLVDGFFVLGQPYLQWQLVRKARARELSVGLLL